MSASVEVLPTITATEARVLIDRIKVVLEAGANLIIQAWESRAWVPLGYSSWKACCVAEFDTCWLRVPREARRELVASMSDAGMSTRAIAAAVGVDQKTVVNDLSSGEENSSPDPDVVDVEIVNEKPGLKLITGTDGKKYRAKPKTTSYRIESKPKAEAPPAPTRPKPDIQTVQREMIRELERKLADQEVRERILLAQRGKPSAPTEPKEVVASLVNAIGRWVKATDPQAWARSFSEQELTTAAVEMRAVHVAANMLLDWELEAVEAVEELEL